MCLEGIARGRKRDAETTRVLFFELSPASLNRNERRFWSWTSRSKTTWRKERA